MEEDVVTFNEIMEFTKLSHNSVSKKMKALGITYKYKQGRTMLYTKSDMEKINAFRPDPFKPGTKFYRVSIRVGRSWFVMAAGLPISRAKLLAEDYKKKKIAVKYIPCA